MGLPGPVAITEAGEAQACARCPQGAVVVVDGHAACLEHLEATMRDALAPLRQALSSAGYQERARHG